MLQDTRHDSVAVGQCRRCRRTTEPAVVAEYPTPTVNGVETVEMCNECWVECVTAADVTRPEAAVLAVDAIEAVGDRTARTCMADATDYNRTLPNLREIRTALFDKFGDYDADTLSHVASTAQSNKDDATDRLYGALQDIASDDTTPQDDDAPPNL